MLRVRRIAFPAALALAALACKSPPSGGAGPGDAGSTSKPPAASSSGTTWSIDQVCSQFVRLYDAKLLDGHPEKVDPNTHKKEIDDCTVDAQKTQADDPAKFQCIGACAMATNDTLVAQRCRKTCEPDPEKFCRQLLDDLDRSKTDEAAVRCAKSLKDAKSDAERRCRRDCVIAAKNTDAYEACADASCPTN